MSLFFNLLYLVNLQFFFTAQNKFGSGLQSNFFWRTLSLQIIPLFIDFFLSLFLCLTLLCVFKFFIQQCRQPAPSDPSRILALKYFSLSHFFIYLNSFFLYPFGLSVMWNPATCNTFILLLPINFANKKLVFFFIQHFFSIFCIFLPISFLFKKIMNLRFSSWPKHKCYSFL